MSIKINVEDVKMSGEAKALNNIHIIGSENIEIEAKKLELSDSAQLLEHIDVIAEEVTKEVATMDKNSEEYTELKRITQNISNKELLLQQIFNHLKDYSQGVLAKIISGYIKG